METLNRISWWDWIPFPWRRWKVVLIVGSADEIPEVFPISSAVLVGTLVHPKWLAFDCPCRRGHRVMLNLDSRRKPSWSISNPNKLTINPSVNDRSIDDRCHYFIRKGKVVWAP